MRTIDYTAQHIANFFLDKSQSKHVNMTPMKLIKMVYIAHGWSLAMLEKPLLAHEPVEAWKHGPVIPSLYHEFKLFGSRNITCMAVNTDVEADNIIISKPTVSSADKDLLTVLNGVWNVYHKYTGFGLRDLLHEDGTPWQRVFESHKNNEITDESTQAFYTAELSRIMNVQ